MIHTPITFYKKSIVIPLFIFSYSHTSFQKIDLDHKSLKEHLDFELQDCFGSRKLVQREERTHKHDTKSQYNSKNQKSVSTNVTKLFFPGTTNF